MAYQDEDENFAKYCLQTLAPLINFPFHDDDKEIIKSQNHPCNCSKSGCLKLYCECFANGLLCIGCNCINCFNTFKYENIRRSATVAVLSKTREEKKNNKKIGCNCKKSNCLKKYCCCHVKGRVCSEQCKCVGCNNLRASQI